MGLESIARCLASQQRLQWGALLADLTVAARLVADTIISMSQAKLNDRTRALALKRASEHHEAGRHGEAVAQYDSLIQNGFASPEIYAVRAVCKQSWGDQYGAIADCNTALDQQPRDVFALYTRALSRRILGDYDLAIRDLGAVLAEDHRYGDALYVRAIIYADMRQWEDAISDWTTLLAMFPGDWRALHFRAMAYRDSGRLEEALTDYTAAIEGHPHLINLYARRSEIYRLLGQHELAEKDADHSRPVVPKAIGEPDICSKERFLSLLRNRSLNSTLSAATENNPRPVARRDSHQ